MKSSSPFLKEENGYTKHKNRFILADDGSKPVSAADPGRKLRAWSRKSKSANPFSG
jgi:hypothetical protein